MRDPPRCHLPETIMRRPKHWTMEANDDTDLIDGTVAIDWNEADLLEPIEDPLAKPHRLSKGCAAAHLYMKELKRLRRLDRSEEESYARRMAQGDTEAFRILVESNLGLVLYVVRRFWKSGVPLEDLIEEGNLGLIEALRRFDPHRGVRFSTYAVHWIWEYMAQGIRTQGSLVPVSSHTSKAVKACRRALAHLAGVAGKEPTSREIASAVGMSAERVEQLLEQRGVIVPLGTEDETLDENLESETLPASEFPDLAEAIAEEDLEGRLSVWLERLGPRMREVILRRYGLYGQEPEKLRELAARFDVTDSRVQQMQVEALHALRAIAAEEGLVS